MAQRPSQADATTTVTAEQVEQLAVALLEQTWAWQWDGYCDTERDLYRVLVAAAVQQASVTSVCGHFTASPSANWVWHVLQTQGFDGVDAETLEAELNDLLWQRLPPGLLEQRRRVVSDLTLRPYYGKTGQEPNQLRRGEAKAGTTRFHGYATAYVIEDGRRVTLAVSFVWAEEALLDVLTDLLDRLRQRGVQISRLDLDRGFASVAILRWLDQQQFLSVVALPKRGQRFKALLAGAEPIQTTDTMTSADAGEFTFPLWIAYCPPDGDRTTPAYLAFAVLGPRPADLDVAGVAEAYRERFGVEARYRQTNELRVRTTSRDPRYRLLLVGLACLLTNLWVYLKAVLVAAVPPALAATAQRWLDTHFRLATLRALLFVAIAERYQLRKSLTVPFPVTAVPKL